MRFWLMLGLAVLCGCDKLSGTSSGGTEGDETHASFLVQAAEAGLPVPATLPARRLR